MTGRARRGRPRAAAPGPRGAPPLPPAVRAERRLVSRAASSLRRRLPRGFRPAAAVVLGTGLGGVAEAMESRLSLPYDTIPGFPVSTVEGHRGALLAGTIRGRQVLAMEGRFHFYEGYSLREVTFPVRVFRELGASTLVLTNACGGLDPLFRGGDLMVMDDHINLMGDSPLRGPNDDALGPRFPDMGVVYDRDLLALAEEVALGEGIPLRRGVYAAVPGPQLETRAEYRMLRILGAHAVGMSTVPEAIVAVHSGMRVLGFSVVTDMCLPDHLEPVDIGRILAAAAKAGPGLARILLGCIGRLPIT
ncbi:MAG: purine-nucleoside phosphorylase [Planctomycetes bacterium]|nr:purine-nucleoside phosphorylase [Planctomycetota bacterium]